MAQTTPRRQRRRPTAEVLIETAERMIAEHGVQGVSMRQIAVEAGQNNAGVTQYHFGNLDGLLDAILEARLPAINATRHELIAELALEGRADDYRGLLQAMILPMAWASEEGPFVAFLGRLIEYRKGLQWMVPRDESLLSGANLIVQRLAALADHLPDATIRARTQAIYTIAIQTLGQRRRVLDSEGSEPDWLITVDDLIEMLAAGFAAPLPPTDQVTRPTPAKPLLS